MTHGREGITRRDDIAEARSLLKRDAHAFNILVGIHSLSDRELAIWLHNYGSPLARFRLCNDAFHLVNKDLYKNLWWRMMYITSRLNSGALPDDIFPDAAG